jgi:hypothetical protein
MNLHTCDNLGSLIDGIANKYSSHPALIAVGEYRTVRYTFSQIHEKVSMVILIPSDFVLGRI